MLDFSTNDKELAHKNSFVPFISNLAYGTCLLVMLVMAYVSVVFIISLNLERARTAFLRSDNREYPFPVWYIVLLHVCSYI